MNQRAKSVGKASNSRGMLVIVVIVLILMAILVNGSNRLMEKNRKYENQITDLSLQMHDEQVREEKIAEMIGQVDSDEYIEKIARQKLGLVYENEVVYKAEE